MKFYLSTFFFILSISFLYCQEVTSVYSYKKIKVLKEEKSLEKIKKSEIILYSDSTYKFYQKTNKFHKNRKKGIISGLYLIRDKYEVIDDAIVFYQNGFVIFRSSDDFSKIKVNNMEYFLK